MTTKTLDDLRLVDVSLEKEKKISQFIENQFPAIYREDGRELIDLVKAYYEFLEENELQSIYNIRRIYEYRNIDTTLDRMLVFFKNKFLNGLFFEIDTRFLVKNILDLYRRKGSREGIQLFFRLFFESEVDIYFPSEDIFKPSTSLWKVGSFIQLYSTNDFSKFDGIINKRIYGNSSNASAFVDDIFFVLVSNAYLPILFLSDVKGEFIGFDDIYSIDPEFVSYGRVYGSLRSVDVDPNNPDATGNNSVGDIVDILSDKGFGAKGRVTDVTSELSGNISFSVEDGNYGYTVSNTDILVSDQSAFLNTGEGLEFLINERVRQVNSSNTEVFGTIVGRQSGAIGLRLNYSELDQQKLFVNTSGTEYDIGDEVSQINTFDIEVFGTIVDEQEGFILVDLDKSLPEVSTERYFFESGRPVSTTANNFIITKQVIDVEDDYFFETGFEIETVDRDDNISKPALFTTPKNTTARAEIGTLKNTETITIVTDIIENFLNVPIDSNNYSQIPPAVIEMSGTRVDPSLEPNLSTPLNVAFVPETFTIGAIDQLANINPGFNYINDVFVLARENLLNRFNLQNQILNINVPFGVGPILEGNRITQEKEIQNFDGTISQTTVKGQVVKVIGNDIYVKQLTFESFVTNEPIFKEGSIIPITVNSRSRDVLSPPLGMNAHIDGNVETIVGKIKSVDVIDSGIGYEDGSTVTIIARERRQAVIDDLKRQLDTFLGLKAEFEELEELFGFSDVTDSIKKRWKLQDIASAMLSGGQGQQPQRELFVNTVVPETGLQLGDVDQNGIFEFEDYALFLSYVQNIDNSIWRNDNEALVTYIETIMFPFMEDNYSTYQVYGIFPIVEFDGIKARQNELLSFDFDDNISEIESQIDAVSFDTDARGTAFSRRQGITEGKWEAFKSHTNREKVIQDSFFYQDYSYEITTDVSPNEYEIEYRNQMHPAGLKLFTRVGAIAVINKDIDTFSNIRVFDEVLQEPSNVSFINGNGFQYLNA